MKGGADTTSNADRTRLRSLLRLQDRRKLALNEKRSGEVPVEHYDPSFGRCPFVQLCGASAAALLVFLGVLQLVG